MNMTTLNTPLPEDLMKLKWNGQFKLMQEMIDLPVTDSLAGRLVKDLTLPDGVLISTQIFQDQSEVVHGDTRLKAGATLYLVVNESNISQVRKLFL